MKTESEFENHFKNLIAPTLKESANGFSKAKRWELTQYEAESILSPSLVNILIKIKEDLGSNIDFSFVRAHLFMRCDLAGTPFNQLLNRTYTYDDFGKFYVFFSGAFNIIENMKMDVKT